MSGDLRVINHMSSSGSSCSSYVNASVQEELPSVPPLCPPAQRWQMWPPQWKYWELPGHLSGNIWAIWTITFCKWTQIKMYVVAFARASASFCGSCHSYPSNTIAVLFMLSVSATQPGVRSICCEELSDWPRSHSKTLHVSVWKLQVMQALWVQVNWTEEKWNSVFWKQGCSKCLHDMCWPITLFVQWINCRLVSE